MAGLMAPDGFPVRDPKSRPKNVGRVVNPVGWPEMGGLTSAGKWPGGNSMEVEKPTRVRAAHSSARKNQE